MTFTTVNMQEGKTPLYVTSKVGYIETVQVLLEAKANTDLTNKVRFLLYNCNGLLIMIIITFSQLKSLMYIELFDLVMCLITVISVYIQNGKTPLYTASKKGYTKIVQLLLNDNAMTDIANLVSYVMYNYTGPLLR